MRETVGRASDPQPGDHHEGNKEKGPREGDLDVLSASGQVQTSSSITSVQERRAQIDSCWCNIPAMFVDPASRTAYYWMALVTVAVIYNWIVIILRVAFEDMREGDFSSKMFRVLDIISDVIYLMDVAIQSRTAYLEDGCLVKSLPETVRHYRNQPRFILDVLSVVPLTKIFSFLSVIYPLPFFQSGSDSIAAPGMRVLRLLKYPSMNRFFEKTDSRTNNPNLLRAFKLSLHLWLVIHWICCFYYLISRYEGLGINEWVYPNTTEYSPFSRKYIFCMYWSTMTLTTIGERPWPVTDVEFIFTGLTFLIGVFVFAAVVGNVGDVISNMNAARHDFQARMDQIKFYLNHRHVPEHLQDQIKRWAEYTWARTKAIDEHSIMQLLPNRLRTEVAIHVHLEALKRVRIFEQCEEGLLRELVLKLRPSIYSPGEYICRIGEIGREMYIIDHGKVEILFPDRKNGIMKQVAVMMPGNYFGEISLLKLDDGQNKRTADVRSIGFSELLCLSRRDLMSALMEYPEAKKVLETQARERMQQTKWTSSEVHHSSATEETVDLKKPTGRRSARTIFAEVMKQEGFANLLSSKANQELGEMRKILKELQEVKRHLSDTSVYQLAKQCQNMEEELSKKDQELQRLRTQLLHQRQQNPSASSVIHQILPTNSMQPQDSPLPSKSFGLPAAGQSTTNYSSGVVLPDDPVALHKRLALPSLKGDIYGGLVGGEHSQKHAGTKGALGGGGDELVVPKIHVTQQDNHAENSNMEMSAHSMENDSDPSIGSTVYQSPIQSGTNVAPSEGADAVVATAAVAQSDSGFNLASLDMSSQKQHGPKHTSVSENPEKELPQSQESASNSSYTDTSCSTSTCSSGGRWTGPKPAKPKPKYKPKENCETDSHTAQDGDTCKTKQNAQDEPQKMKTPVIIDTGKVRAKLDVCLSSEGFSAMSTTSESWGTESLLSSSGQTGSSESHTADTASSGRASSQCNQPTQKVFEQAEKRNIENPTPSEKLSVVNEPTCMSTDQTCPVGDDAQNLQRPWDDPAMLEAAGISPEDLIYLEENEPLGVEGNSINNDEDDGEFIPATRVKSDFDKRISKEDQPAKVVTCRKIDDTQLSILLAKRREANDSPDYIVESVKNPDMLRCVGTADHSHSIHAVVDSKEELAPCETLDSNETEDGITFAHLNPSPFPYSKKSVYSKVDFFIKPPTSSVKVACEKDNGVEDMSCMEQTQNGGTGYIVSISAEPSRETEEPVQCEIKRGENSGLSNSQQDLQSEGAEQNRDGQDAGTEPPAGSHDGEENGKKYPVSILKKTKSDATSEEAKESTKCEESVDTSSHQTDCRSLGEVNSTSVTVLPSPQDATLFSESFCDTSDLAQKDDSPIVDHKLQNGKKSKRGRNRDIDIEVGMFPSNLKNETSQSPFGAKPDDSLPDPTDNSPQELHQAMPTPETEHQEFIDDQDQEEEENLATLRRRYSASRYRRRSIDHGLDAADSSPADSWIDSDLSFDREASSETVLPMSTGSPGPSRKHSEKFDSLIATFDSQKKKSAQEDSVSSAEKTCAALYPRSEKAIELAEEYRSNDSASVDRGSKAMAMLSRSCTVDKKGNAVPKEDSKDGEASRKAPIPNNSPPQKRKTLRRRSLTKRLSNPGSKKEIQASEKSQTACSKEVVKSVFDKRSEKDSVGQESPGEGASAPVSLEKTTEQEKDRDRKLVSPGPEGEIRHSPTRGCTVSPKLGNSRASARTSDSALGEYEALQKKRSASHLGFGNISDNLNSSADCRRNVSRADSQAASQRKKSPCSISPVSFKDKIQHGACRLKSYEAMDRANNSTLTSDDSNSSSPSAQENSIRVSMHTSYNATQPNTDLSQVLMDHVADQASMVVENLLRPISPSSELQKTPSTAGSSAEFLAVYQPFGNISNSMYQPWVDEHDPGPSSSPIIGQVSTANAQDEVLQESPIHDHLKLSVENNGKQSSINTMHDHFQMYAGASSGQFQLENKHDHSRTHVEIAQDHTQAEVERTLDHTHIDVSEDRSTFADFSNAEERITISETEGSQEDSGLMERIVGGAMVEALRLNPGLLASVGAVSNNDGERVVGEVGSLILLADFGVEDDDEGALSDMSGCDDQSDANTDLDDM